MASIFERAARYLASPTRALRYASARYHEARWRRKAWGPPPPESRWKLGPGVRESITIGWPHLGAKPGVFTATLQQAFRQTFRVEEIDAPISDRAIARFEVRHSGGVIPVVLDFRDKDDLVEEHVPSSAVYLKMQFRQEGYAERKVMPAGYVTGLDLVIPALGDLRARRDRASEKFDVYGRFGMHSAESIRRSAVQALSNQADFQYEGGVEIVRFGQYLLEMAESRICLDLPGQGVFCYRLVDYLSVGSCIVSVRHTNRMHVPFTDGHDIAYVDRDLSNLLEATRYYLARPDERRKLVRNSRDFFDKYLHPVQLVRYYVKSALEAGSA